MNSAAQMSKGPRRVSACQLHIVKLLGDVPKLPESLAEIMVNRRW